MASFSRLLILLASFGLQAWTQRPEPWTVTSYLEEYKGVTTDSRGRTSTDKFGSELPVTPTVSEPRAITTRITTEKYIFGPIPAYESPPPLIVRYVVVLEPGQGDVNTDPPQSSSTYQYNVALDLTMPTGCTYTESTTRVPSSTHTTATLNQLATIDLAGVVNPIEETTAVIERERTWLLDPTEIPQVAYDGARNDVIPALYRRCENRYYHFDGNYSNCMEYSWTPLGNSLGGGFECSNGIFHTWGLQTWSFIVVLVFSWFGFFLFVGCWESYSRFERLMTGNEARRGIPCAWGCLVPVVGLILLCLFRSDGFSGLPTREERDSMRKQWKAMPALKKLRLWLRYGVTYSYPPILGSPPPPRTGPLYQPPANGQASGDTELVPPPYTRIPTPRTSTDTPAEHRPDPTLPQEPPRYEAREGREGREEMP